jgi:transcriptional activator SPT7
VGENDIASPPATESTMTVGDSNEIINEAEDKKLSEHQQPEEEQELVPLIINQEAGQALMQRTVVKLIEHAGFEGTQTSALSVLSDVATNYFMSLGKTLRVYWDGYCNNMTDEEILTHTLYDNGIEAIQELEEYITDDIEKYGHRLNDIQRKLTSSYNELVNGSTDVQLPDDSFFQSDDAFVNGAFGDDIGEDFFGFKDLGLDKELNLDRINVSVFHLNLAC